MHREEIEVLTHAVNNMLTLYLDVHNGMFTHPWWRSIPIPGLFKAIPYDQYEIQISSVEEMLSEVEQQVRSLRKSAQPFENEYLVTLHQYIDALLQTAAALNPIVSGLKAKADGRQYAWSTYSSDLSVYRTAETGYHLLGAEMNRKWHEYQERRAKHGD